MLGDDQRTIDFNDRLAATEDRGSRRMARQTPEERKRRFDEQRKMIDSIDAEDEMMATKSALDQISKKERILNMSKERAASRGLSSGRGNNRPQTAP